MFYIFSLLLGMIFGSFMNVLICRLPYGNSIVFPPSSCPVCKSRIRFYDNIPIISFLLLGGKCRDCHTKISYQYPLVELVTGAFFLAVYAKFGISVLALRYFVFVFLLLTIAFTDLFTSLDTKNFECGVIPVILTRGGIILGFIFALFSPSILNSLLNSFLGVLVGGLVIWLPGFIYKLVTKREGMGFGDVELFGMIGAFLGYKPILLILFLSSFIGTIVGIPVIMIKKNRYFPIPFGPFISLATMVYIFYGDGIIQLYSKLILGIGG